MSRRLRAVLALLPPLLGGGLVAQATTVRATSVVLVTLDGLRWQEMFGGAEALLLFDTATTPSADARARYWDATPEERRELLMPFFWQVVAREGQVFGNRLGGGGIRVSNGLKFSYPGYQELLAGYPDRTITSNDKRANLNVTVLEWLQTRPGLAGRVAAFGTWDVFPYILDEPRSHIPVNAGWDTLELPRPTPGQALLNVLMTTLPREWDRERYDALTYLAAREYLLAERPGILYIALGEPDAWAHGGRYDRYLEAAHNADAFLRDLWETLQHHPRYRGRTAMVVTTDHGRGTGRRGWSRHGQNVAGAEWIWAAVLGPDTPSRGLRDDVRNATQGQIAATVAALLGEDWAAAEPRAAPALPGVVSDDQ